MADPIKTLSIKGFKSIKSLEGFELQKLNVLIGANGAGKSNFVEFFRMLRAMADEGFQNYVLQNGGSDGFLYMGPKITKQISARLDFGKNWYEMELQPTASGSLLIASETPGYMGSANTHSGLQESTLKSNKNQTSYVAPGNPGIGHYIYNSVSNWTVYHFHDTSPLATMRRDQPLQDWQKLRHDASNIAPFLFNLKDDEPDIYLLIRNTVRLIAPFFDDFLLRPQTKGTNEQIRLEWTQKGSDFPFQPNQLSDGTIRFVCLTTALLQPEPPATVIIDEPELGLHPYAISILSDLIKSASEQTQVIISTQSPTLLNYFDPDQTVVVERADGESTFKRLAENDLDEWLSDYSLGEVWDKNVFGGGPTRE